MVADRALSPEETALAAQAVRDGERAQAILNEPIFAAAVKQVKERLFRDWMEATEAEELRRLHAEARSIDHVCRELRTTIGSGQLAAEKIRRDARKEP